MSDFSLTLVLQFKTSKIINDMAKVQIKSEKITPFGGIFHVREPFSHYVGPIIDKVLGLRCTSYGYLIHILSRLRQLKNRQTEYPDSNSSLHDY